jgi:hypothetical protein
MIMRLEEYSLMQQQQLGGKGKKGVPGLTKGPPKI